MSRERFTDADVTYITANFVRLEALCAARAESADDVRALVEQRLLPQPSYVLPDGTGMFPTDYFRLLDEAGVDGLRDHFAARHRTATRAAQRARPDELERDWEAYLDGAYGVCLRHVTPETIVRKRVLVSSLCELLMLPRPDDAEWRRTLRCQIDELDELEREFAPDCDRSDAHGRPPTRDVLVRAARERHPHVFREHGSLAP
jgi:hypothetical protein